MPVSKESDARPAVMAPSVAKDVAIDRSLLLCAAGRAPFDVAYLLMKQRAATAANADKRPDTAAQASRAALSVSWSLQNQTNIRGKWNIV
jgi:hypothetical protein